MRTIPASGQIILPEGTASLDEVLGMGCWTPVSKTAIRLAGAPASDGAWQATLKAEDGSVFDVLYHGQTVGTVTWNMTGMHSVANGIAAIAAAHHIDIAPAVACAALSNFGGVKRRMELLGTVRGIDVYDDFAHHPTAIETTLDGIRKKIGARRLWAIIEPRSNTMRMGNFKAQLADSARVADQVIWYQPDGLDWDLQPVVAAATNSAQVANTLDSIVSRIKTEATDGDVVVIMSNGGFGGLHGKILAALGAV